MRKPSLKGKKVGKHPIFVIGDSSANLEEIMKQNTEIDEEEKSDLDIDAE